MKNIAFSLTAIAALALTSCGSASSDNAAFCNSTIGTSSSCACCPSE